VNLSPPAAPALAAAPAAPAAVAPAAISVSALRKSFSGTPLLDSLSFAVAPSECFFILGPSASGKTTLLRLLAGILPADSGEIRIFDVDAAQLSRQSRRTAFLSQRDSLWPHLTLRENLEFQHSQNTPAVAPSVAAPVAAAAVAAAAVPSASAAIEQTRAAAQELLTAFGLEALATRRPAELSASERCRAALARALATDPAVLLLDDPFLCLAPDQRRRAWQHIRRLCADTGLAAICVTQHLPDAFAFADRAAFLANGFFHQIASPCELYRRPATRLTGEFLSGANVIEGILLYAGAGEFIAKTPLGEIRGSLADPAADPKQGVRIDILIRPESLHLDTFPPEENVFSGAILSGDFCGEYSHLCFRSVSGHELRVADLNPRVTGSAFAQKDIYLWSLPEDITGILR
jgi:ABC-type Fe3+/spermidine/putrescine transport system ATPase subunit